MKQKQWSKLVKGDRIICPMDGVTETVLWSRWNSGQRRQVVRTSRHDHYQERGATVEVQG